MMYCTRCGRPLDPADLFCRSCGAPVPKNPPAGKTDYAGFQSPWQAANLPDPGQPAGGNRSLPQDSFQNPLTAGSSPAGGAYGGPSGNGAYGSPAGNAYNAGAYPPGPSGNGAYGNTAGAAYGGAPYPQTGSAYPQPSSDSPFGSAPRYGTDSSSSRTKAAKTSGKVPGERVNRAGNRAVKALISAAIAAAICAVFVIFFEIDLTNMDGYVRMASRAIGPLYFFDENYQNQVAAIGVYGLAVMVVLSAFMLPARLSGAIMKTCGVGDKIVVTLAGYFLIAFILFLKQQVIDQNVIGRMASDVMRAHGADRLVAVLLFLLLIVLLLIPVGFIWWSAQILWGVVAGNLQVNGPILGIPAAAYELLSSVFVTALVLGAFSFGVAIILLPFLILIGCQSGRRVVCIDGEYYYVD